VPDTYDLTTIIGQVRLLIPDRDLTALLFSDVEIETFLALELNNPYRAAALALETKATELTLGQSATVRLADGTSISDSTSAMESFRKRAQSLREQADAAEAKENDGSFGIAEMASSDFAVRQIVNNSYRRRL